ncbi:hypothetical protein PM082_021713 [Marasmius tenuissimus]|nr:hypothetical protein PM082_021713 [Marasmius tenuissimus]
MPSILALTPASQGSGPTGTASSFGKYRWTTGKRRLSLTPTEVVFTVLVQYAGVLVLPCLFAVLSAQIYIYYLTSAAKDRRLIKAVVYGIYALVTAQVVWSSQEGYNLFVSRHPSRPWLGWLFVPIIGGVVSLGVQVLYAWRISVLSQSRIVPMALVALSVISSVASIIAATSSAKAGGVENLRNSPELPIAAAIWCCTSALCDILIAAYVTYLLTRNGFLIKDTKRVVVRIVRLTIETNALTAALAVVTAALLLGVKDQGYYTVFSLILPSIYGNTLLVMMNSRIRLSHGSSGSDNIVNISGGASMGSVQSQGCSHCSRQFTAAHSSMRFSALRVPQSPRDEESSEISTKGVQRDSSDYEMHGLRAVTAS